MSNQQLTQKQKAEQRRREAAERIEANRRKLAEQAAAAKTEDPPADEWSSPDSPVQEEPDAPVDETIIGPQGPVLEEPQPATTISVNPETDDLPPRRAFFAKIAEVLEDGVDTEKMRASIEALKAEGFAQYSPVDHVAAFKDWLRTPAGLDASDPRMPENDRARFACELDNRLRMAWLAGVASVEEVKP